MQRLYRAIEPAGSVKTRAISLVEGLVHDYSLLDGLAHRVTTELPERTGNLGHLAWKNPFTDEVSTESFPRSLTARCSITSARLPALSRPAIWKP